MKKLILGDILEVRTAKGLAYLQVALRNATFGEFVRILPGIFSERPGDLEMLAKKDATFSTFFPASYATGEGLLEKIGHADVPENDQVLPLMRMGVDRDGSGSILSWSLFDGEKQVAAKMAEDERELPIVSVPSFDVLQRMITGEHPTHE